MEVNDPENQAFKSKNRQEMYKTRHILPLNEIQWRFELEKGSQRRSEEKFGRF